MRWVDANHQTLETFWKSNRQHAAVPVKFCLAKKPLVNSENNDNPMLISWNCGNIFLTNWHHSVFQLSNWCQAAKNNNSTTKSSSIPPKTQEWILAIMGIDHAWLKTTGWSASTLAAVCIVEAPEKWLKQFLWSEPNQLPNQPWPYLSLMTSYHTPQPWKATASQS